MGGAIAMSIGLVEVTIDETTFTNNSAMYGGAIAFPDTGTPTTVTAITNSVFSGNDASIAGGAMYVAQPLGLTNVTMTENTSVTHGGGIYIDGDSDDAELDISFSTFTKNIADSDDNGSGTGGAFYLNGVSGDMAIRNSLFAANYLVSTSGTPSDCTGSTGLASLNYNYIASATGCTFTAQANDDVGSGTQSYMATAELADNGGEIETLRIYGSETLDTIPPASCLDAAGADLTSDARGMTRPEDTNCDMGAYELDQTDPAVVITSGDDAVECGVDTWTDAGATVTDNFSNNLTASLTSGSVSSSTVGTYPIVYTSTADTGENTGTNTRSVTVSDTTAPTITVTGDATQTLTVGDSYTDSGATATDACDASVAVTTGGDTVDTTTAGTYTLTYSASDDSTNSATQKTRTVTVIAAENETPQEDVVTITTNGKYVVVKVNGEVVSRKKVGNKKLSRKYRKLKTKQLYTHYTTVALLTATKRRAKLTVFRLTENNTLKKKTSKSFSFTKRNTLKLKFKANKKRIITTVGKNTQKVQKTWKLTKKGKLKKL